MTYCVNIYGFLSRFWSQNMMCCLKYVCVIQAGEGIPCWPNPVATLLVFTKNDSVTPDEEMAGWAAPVEGKKVIDRGFCPARFGSGEWRSVRLVVLVRGRLSGMTGLVRPAWSSAVPGAQRLKGRVRETTGGLGSAGPPPSPNIAIPASPPDHTTYVTHFCHLKKIVTFFILPSSVLSPVRLVLVMVDKRLSFTAITLLFGSSDP